MLPPDGQLAFGNALEAGLSPATVVSITVTSQNYRQKLVPSYYLQLLDRPVDSIGLDACVNPLQHGVRNENVIAQFVGSLEYFN